jgi:hypothetical protein
MSTPVFDDAESAFKRFAVAQGYPAMLLWTVPDELIFWRGRFLVLDGEAGVRRERAKAAYDKGAARNVGIEIDGKCKTNRITICRVYVAEDETDAQYRMMPQSGIKMSLSQNDFPAVIVSNEFMFAVLRWWRRRKWAQPDWW